MNREDVTTGPVEPRQQQHVGTDLDHRIALSGEEVFIEREARRLGLVRPGERLFIVKGVEARRKASLR